MDKGIVTGRAKQSCLRPLGGKRCIPCVQPAPALHFHCPRPVLCFASPSREQSAALDSTAGQPATPVVPSAPISNPLTSPSPPATTQEPAPTSPASTAADTAATAQQAEQPTPTTAEQQGQHQGAQQGLQQGQEGGQQQGPQQQGTQRVGRFLYTWPWFRPVRERPDFLSEYPPQDGTFNINSFLGKNDVHQGKFLVPPAKYNRFLKQYYQAYQDGYRLFCTEVYGTRPFRYFVELDFDWELPQYKVEAVFKKLYYIVRRAVQETYGLMSYPMVCVSMRTPYKVHLNCPRVLTTELRAMMCREKIISACESDVTEPWDWESIVDFPHGSFRMLGAMKSTNIVKEPTWVRDKAYYPVRYNTDTRSWVPDEFTLDRLCLSSIQPTPDQMKKFEQSSAYLAMIYSDASAYEQRMREKLAKRLADRAEQIKRLEQQYGDAGLAAAAAGSGGADDPAIPSNAPTTAQPHTQNPTTTTTTTSTTSTGTLPYHQAMSHKERVMQAQLDKVASLRLSALKEQEQALIRARALAAGALGQRYLQVEEDCERLAGVAKQLQRKLMLLTEQKRLTEQQRQQQQGQQGDGAAAAAGDGSDGSTAPAAAAAAAAAGGGAAEAAASGSGSQPGSSSSQPLQPSPSPPPTASQPTTTPATSTASTTTQSGAGTSTAQPVATSSSSHDTGSPQGVSSGAIAQGSHTHTESDAHTDSDIQGLTEDVKGLMSLVGTLKKTSTELRAQLTQPPGAAAAPPPPAAAAESAGDGVRYPPYKVLLRLTQQRDAMARLVARCEAQGREPDPRDVRLLRELESEVAEATQKGMDALGKAGAQRDASP